MLRGKSIYYRNAKIYEPCSANEPIPIVLTSIILPDERDRTADEERLGVVEADET